MCPWLKKFWNFSLVIVLRLFLVSWQISACVFLYSLFLLKKGVCLLKELQERDRNLKWSHYEFLLNGPITRWKQRSWFLKKQKAFFAILFCWSGRWQMSTNSCVIWRANCQATLCIERWVCTMYTNNAVEVATFSQVLLKVVLVMDDYSKFN